MTVNTMSVDELTYQERWVQDEKGQHFWIRKERTVNATSQKDKSTRRTEDVTVFTEGEQTNQRDGKSRNCQG